MFPRPRSPSQTLQIVLRIGMAIVFLMSLALIALGHLLIASLGHLSSVSTASFAGLYFLADVRLTKDGVGTGESIALSLLYANAMLQLYEIIYHFSFPVYFNYFRYPFLSGDDARFLIFQGLMVLPIYLTRRNLRLGFASLFLGLLFVLTWTLWILYGFPQYFVPGQYYTPQVLHTADPTALAQWFDFGSKGLLALSFAALVQRTV